MVERTAALLPSERPRYLMGGGRQEDLVHAVGAGVDLFDFVMPTRHARNLSLFTSAGTMNIKRSEFRTDPRPLDPACSCETCRGCSRSVPGARPHCRRPRPLPSRARSPLARAAGKDPRPAGLADEPALPACEPGGELRFVGSD
jgi:hypothetical protein